MKTSWTWFVGSIVASLALLVSSARADLPALQRDAAELHGLVHVLGEQVNAGLGNSPALPFIVVKVQQLENRALQTERIVARPISQQQLFAEVDLLDRLTEILEDAVFDAGRGPFCHVNTRGVQQALAAIQAKLSCMDNNIASLRACDFPSGHIVGRPVFGNGQYPGSWNGNWNCNHWNQPQPVNPGVPGLNQPVGPTVPSYNTWYGRPGTSFGGNGLTFNGRGISLSLGR